MATKRTRQHDDDEQLEGDELEQQPAEPDTQAVSTKETDYVGRVLLTPGTNSKDYLGRVTTATTDHLGRLLLDV